MVDAHIDDVRFQQNSMDLARIGPLTGGGFGCLAVADGDHEARDLIANWRHAEGSGIYAGRLDYMLAWHLEGGDTPPPVTIRRVLVTQRHGDWHKAAKQETPNQTTLKQNTMFRPTRSTDRRLQRVVWCTKSMTRCQCHPKVSE